jgi:AraC-like DNA-binding protein
MRQTTPAVSAECPLFGRALEYGAGQRTGRHSHEAAQLVYAVAGTMTVDVEEGLLVVPPLRAVWIPPEMCHDVVMQSRVSMRTVYIHHTLAKEFSDRCMVLGVSNLLRELLVEAAKIEKGLPARQRYRLIVEFIMDELKLSRQLPLLLPDPQDPRLLRITREIRDNPGDNRTLDAWSRCAGASSRTLARLFEKETGMTFGHWRRQAKLLAALQRLADREPVSVVSAALGYATPSAFTHMFRQALGVSPSAYFSDPVLTANNQDTGS